jgi:hypothetical protein
MDRSKILKMRQASLRADIAALLDSFLIGTVAKSPSMSGYSLTTKKEGKTVTFYVRKDLVPMALEMSRRYRHLWFLLQKLSNVNREILNLQSQ